MTPIDPPEVHLKRKEKHFFTCTSGGSQPAHAVHRRILKGSSQDDRRTSAALTAYKDEGITDDYMVCCI